MKRILFLSAFFLTTISSLLANEPAIIPRPEKLDVQPGSLTINVNTVIVSDAAFQNEANLLAAKLRTATGFAFPLKTKVAGVRPPAIVLTANGAKDLGTEGYSLTVNSTGIWITAKTSAGIFYGTQTLLQLLPPQIFANHQVSGVTWSVPCVNIEDRPVLAWRGFMLDDSRNFFGKTSVETLLDQLALLKFNVFHWHLSDDNGWRIEIKKYPKLTSIGAWRQRDVKADGPGDPLCGGFYTQEEIREIVAYATARHITVVPEVDFPGHCAAAMAAYPELAPDNGWKPEVLPIEGTAGQTYALCVAKPQTVQFCKDVLDEIMALFPSTNIHIGGDEVNEKQWANCKIAQAALKQPRLKDMTDLQIHFQNEIIAYLESKGRHAIVWNNTYRPTIDKRAINQFWRPPMNHAIDFAKAGYRVLISDSSIYYYDRNPSLQKIYTFQPVQNDFPGGLCQKLVGIEACAWSEHSPSLSALERNVFPQIFAHAELLWTEPARKDWVSFLTRLVVTEQRAEQAGIKYHH